MIIYYLIMIVGSTLLVLGAVCWVVEIVKYIVRFWKRRDV